MVVYDPDAEFEKRRCTTTNSRSSDEMGLRNPVSSGSQPVSVDLQSINFHIESSSKKSKSPLNS